MMKKREVYVGVLAMLLFVGIGIAALFAYNNYILRHEIFISHDSGIYSDSFEFEVKPLVSGTVYYTTDGTEPIPGNETTFLYQEPIFVALQEDTAVYSYRFCCEFADGSLSEIFDRDFILDGREDRFTTEYIISVVGDEEELFGYEQGLFVRGRQFDEYMEKNQDVDLLNTVIPANYFSDEEVEVHASIFLSDGTQIISQNCGLKIYGNITRAKNQKSFRLIARHEYDELNEFSYAFLPKLVSEEGKTPIDAYQRLSLHNSGNDNGYAFMRTQLIGELARKAGFPDVLVSESAVVYVNGRYQGVYWLNNTFDDRYFAEKYGDYVGEFSVCEGTLGQMNEEHADTETERQHCTDYNEFCEWVQQADVQNEVDWSRICKTIDIENFAQYMAIEYYVGNIDWPHNNVKVYRYQCAEGEEYQEGTVFDGKYRYLLFDTDYGMGLMFQGFFGIGAWDRRLDELCETEEGAELFQCLIRRDEFRNLFINEVLNLVNGSFSEESVLRTIVEYNYKRYDELKYMMEETDILKNSLWESDDNSISHVDAEMECIREFGQVRPDIVIDELQQRWGGESVYLEIIAPAEVQLSVNGMRVENDYTGLYLENIPLDITCEPLPGISVNGYMVGEKYMEGMSITIVHGDLMESGETLIIEPAYVVEPSESLTIVSYHISGEDDYVILKNNGQKQVNLSNYAVTDSAGEYAQGHLPNVQLFPGEEYVIYGRRYKGMQVDNSVQVSFAWSTDEEIILAHMSAGVVDVKNNIRNNQK